MSIYLSVLSPKQMDEKLQLEFSNATVPSFWKRNNKWFRLNWHLFKLNHSIDAIITSPGLTQRVFMNACGKFFYFSMEILYPMNEFVAAAVAVTTIKFHEIIIRK